MWFIEDGSISKFEENQFFPTFILSDCKHLSILKYIGNLEWLEATIYTHFYQD